MAKFMTEKEAWQSMIFEANRLGHDGKRVLDFAVVPPADATGTYGTAIWWDNGPTDATEGL